MYMYCMYIVCILRRGLSVLGRVEFKLRVLYVHRRGLSVFTESNYSTCVCMPGGA